MSKVLVIGLDGATWDLIDPWVEQGHLPTFRKLMRLGTRATLQSTIPPLSPPAWATCLTGKYPGKHGIYAFDSYTNDHYSLVPVNGSMLRAETLAEIISRHGLRVLQMNVPTTYPPREVNGIWISGLDTPSNSSLFTYPASLANELVRDFEYEVEPDARYVPGEEEWLRQRVEAVERKRAAAALHLFRSESWDFFMVVFRGTDFLAHFFWRHLDPKHPSYSPSSAALYGQALLDQYRHMDKVIREFLAGLDADTTLLILSDHGFGPHLRWIYLDNLFLQMGLLRSQNRSNAARATRRLFATIQRSPFARLIQKVVPPRARRRAGDWVDPLLRVDWANTSVYPTVGQGLIRVNLRGRDPLGCVSPGSEFEDVVASITNELSGLNDPDTDKPVVRRVWRWEELYSYKAEDSPDLVVEWEPGYMARKGGNPLADDLLSGYKLLTSGNHQIEGILLAYQPQVDAGNLNERVSIADIAPTVLHMLGLSVPDDMDGKALTGLSGARDDKIRYEPARPYSQETTPYAFSDQEQEQVEKRLRDLGYL